MQEDRAAENNRAYFDFGRAFDTIQKLDFIRVCGSEGERRGMEIVAQSLDEIGVSLHYHTFVDKWLEPDDPHLVIDGCKISIQPALELSFTEHVDFVNPQKHCVDIRATLSTDENCAQEIAVTQHYSPETELSSNAMARLMACPFPPEMEAYLWGEWGNPTDRVPTAVVMPKDIPVVLSALGKPAEMKWSVRSTERTFRNLVAEIPGTKWPDDAVVMGAHMDTWPGTTGASDDTAGCAILLEAARWFASHPPARTLKLVWFTGEELDARGSRTYVRECIPDPDAVKLMICVDSALELGTGPLFTYTSNQATINWAHQHLDIGGMENFIVKTPGTDARAFIESGIPVFSLEANCKQSAHLPDDRPETLDLEKFETLASLSIEAANYAANEPEVSLRG